MQANHKFGENNAVLVTAFHPLLGKVGAVVVTQDLEAGDEVGSPFTRIAKAVMLQFSWEKFNGNQLLKRIGFIARR